MNDRPEIKLTRTNLGFWRLVWSDYRAGILSGGQFESPLRAVLLFPLRLLVNPSLQFAFLVRVGQKGPNFLMHPVRWLQVVMFSSEIWWFRGEWAIEIGPGVVFPHPMNVLIGPGAVIGEGVLIYNSTNIGADRHYEESQAGDVAERACRIGDGAVIYAYTVVQGPYNIGEGAAVGLRVILDQHVPPRALITQKGLRLEGEWPGVSGTRWIAAGRPGVPDEAV